MNWQMVLLLNAVIYTIATILIKLVADRIPRTQGIFLQYLICAILISEYWILTDQTKILMPDCFIVLGLGSFVCFGAYSQWRAIKINLSKTALFNPLSEALVIILSLIFLYEFKAWNVRLILGIILSFSAAYLFRIQKTDMKNKNRKEWLFFTLAMVTILGIATFMMKFFSSKMPPAQFLMFWYCGAFLGSFPLLCFEKQNPFIYPGKAIFLIPLVSLGILGNLATVYWAFQLTEASRVMPFQKIGSTFLPILAGWFIFKERVGLSKREILAFLIGAAGILFIIFS